MGKGLKSQFATVGGGGSLTTYLLHDLMANIS